MKIQEETKDEVKEVRQAAETIELKKLGSLKTKKGHKLWEFNGKTGEIKIAVTEEVPHNPFAKSVNGFTEGPKKKIVVNPDCVYVSALNIENAVKKLGLKVKIVKNKK